MALNPPFLTMEHSLSSHDLTNKRVLLRLDLDVPLENATVTDSSRLEAALSTLKHCIEHAQKVLVIGHLGRPEGVDPSLSLKPVKDKLEELLKQTISFVPDFDGLGKWHQDSTPLGLFENLRYHPGESQNDSSFAKALASNFDIFINDAFAVSHRHSASGTEVPKLLPSLMGFEFEAELKGLSPITQAPKRPITVILGGSKTDKIEIVDNLLTQVDFVLVGGSIATQIKANPKVIPATLTPDGLDINQASIDNFARYIGTSSTLIWNGPVGKYQDSLHGFHGTSKLAELITTANAYKVAGGGDTLAVIKQLNLEDKFDHLSTAGGAMIYYIANHTLPALEAILNSPKIS